MLDLFAEIESLLLGFGYFALFGIVFAESGLFFGFFLPGDSLLFTAGLLASQGYFDILIVLAGVSIAAIAGDQVGYWTGSKFGRNLFNRPGSVFFNPKHILDAESFYAKHGKKAVVLARFMPVVRTFAPIVAGIAKMDYGEFVSYNIIGGFLWSFVFVLGGYFLGSAVPASKEWLGYIVVAIIFLSFVPVAFEFLKGRGK